MSLKGKGISGEAHFLGKLEGFNSDLAFVGLSTDSANTITFLAGFVGLGAAEGYL